MSAELSDSTSAGGWLLLPRKEFEKVRSSLQIFPPDQERPVELYEEYEEDSRFVKVPRGIWPLVSDWVEPSFALGRSWEQPLPEPINLRDGQDGACDKIESKLCTDFGTILEAGCGKGKTVMALELARRFKTSTCVLVHKAFLMDQWEERINQFLPGITVGKWQQDRADSGEDFDIVLAMVQSLTGSREYPQEIYDSFGFVITDEVHRFAAPVWQSAIVKFRAKYRLGLTATPERRDGMQAVFLKHIGGIGHTIKGHASTPSVYKIETSAEYSPASYTLHWKVYGDVNTSKLITILANDKSRSQIISNYAVRAVSTGRKVLILSDRLAHVDYIAGEIDANTTNDITVGKYIGGMKKGKLALSAECDVIVGTYAMAQEGLDIPELDTLLLATPKTNITQSVGRILREFPGKKDPVVVDFVDSKIEVLWAYWCARKKRYKSLGYM